MKENMLVLSVLTRLAAEKGKSYGAFVAEMGDAELKRRVRQIRTGIRKKCGSHYLSMREKGDEEQ